MNSLYRSYCTICILVRIRISSLTQSLLLLYYYYHYAYTYTAYIYNVHYAAPLAMIRLVLLFFPLPYHSYSGTAIKCPLFYQLFYGGTLLTVLFQMLGIMILDPDSLSTLVPSTSPGQSVRNLLNHSSSKEHMRHIWLVLSLQLLSDLLHICLLWHVRSTAPSDWSSPTRKHVLYFYTQQQQQNGMQDNNHGHHDPLHLNHPYHRSDSNPAPRHLLDQMRCLPDGYDGT